MTGKTLINLQSVGGSTFSLTHQVGQQEPGDVAAQHGQKGQYPTAQQTELGEARNNIKFLLHGKGLRWGRGINGAMIKDSLIWVKHGQAGMTASATSAGVILLADKRTPFYLSFLYMENPIQLCLSCQEIGLSYSQKFSLKTCTGSGFFK